MTAKTGAVLTALVAAIFSNLGSGYAADVKKSDIPVVYALLLDGKDAIYGQAVCQAYVPCQLINNRATGVQLSVTIDSNQYMVGKISVYCGEPGCSFLTGKTATRLEGTPNGKGARELDLYAGENDTVVMDLLQRTRTRIGRIAILF